MEQKTETKLTVFTVNRTSFRTPCLTVDCINKRFSTNVAHKEYRGLVKRNMLDTWKGYYGYSSKKHQD